MGRIKAQKAPITPVIFFKVQGTDIFTQKVQVADHQVEQPGFLQFYAFEDFHLLFCGKYRKSRHFLKIEILGRTTVPFILVSIRIGDYRFANRASDQIFFFLLNQLILHPYKDGYSHHVTRVMKTHFTFRGFVSERV
jgi:hypothetical protein